MSAQLILVVGGVRSGKSTFALDRAKELSGGAPVRFVATARPDSEDEGIMRRLARHRAARPPHWVTVEEPVDLAAAVRAPGGEHVILVDCLTLWLGNLLAECGDADLPGFSERAHEAVEPRREALIHALREAVVPVIVVTNEVGSGIAPATQLGNVFADVQGETNSAVAAAADEVFHTVAGIATRIK